MPDRDLTTPLRELFGFTAFRGPQEAVCRHLLAGGDALVVMATGEGKSLCYQLPALVQDGLSIVVSPLIALMDDQVAALERRGLPATCVHSNLDARTRNERLEQVLRSEIRLLYCTPERFRVPGFLERIRALRVVLFAVDEAHCVSQWGHDFRPDYQQLGRVREALGDPPTLALTATATPAVQEDILTTLRIPDARRFHTGLDRPNLFLSVARIDEPRQKLDHLLGRLERTGGPGIVYTALIRELSRLEDELRRRGFDPIIYHGDLSAHERREQQARFQASRDAVVLATNAFGMGVDKPDIRFILHWQVPRTLEAYYQEIGRAGRDGGPALCELLYHEEDVAVQREFTEWANPDPEFLLRLVAVMSSAGERLPTLDVQDLRASLLVKNRRDGRIETCLNLLRTAGCTRGTPGRGDFELVRAPTAEEVRTWLPDDKRRRDLEGLLEMVRYANLEGCRKRMLHAWFGFPDDFADGCSACDGEIATEHWLDGAFPAARVTPIPRSDPQLGRTGAEVARGDWLDVQGHGLCAVVRVHRGPRGTRVDVERARDLQSRTLDLGRVRWRKIEP